MQIAGNKERVKLLADLTKYNSRCNIGELGWTMPNVKLSIWGSSDRFVAVKFDNGASMDVLYRSLEIIKGFCLI